MDYNLLAQEAKKRAEKKPIKATGASTGVDPRAWISEIAGTVGGIGGGLVGGPAGAAAGAAGLTALGKIAEQKVKGEAVKPKDVLTESALSGLFAYGPVRAGKGLLGIAKGGTKEAAKQVAQKGVLTSGAKLQGTEIVGRAWGIHPGAKLIPGGKAIGVDKANKLQNFLVGKNVGVPKSASALQAMNIAESYSDDLAKNIAAQLKATNKTYSKSALNSNLRKSFEKVLGAGQKPITTILLPTDTPAQRAAKLAITAGKKSATKSNQFVDDILLQIRDAGNSVDELWKIRLNIDSQLKNFRLSTDAASSLSNSIGEQARRVINQFINKAAPNVKPQFANYSKIQNALTLLEPVVKSPKGTPIPGIGGGVRVAGQLTQKGQATAGFALKKGGAKATEEAAQQAPSLLRQAGTQATRQALATGTRGLLSPIPAGPEQNNVTEDITGLGAEPTPPPIDPRLPKIITAIEQDINKTGGKNIKNIQTIAGLYGIDLTPIGLQPAGAKKSTVDAATKRQLAGIKTGAGIVNELENLITQAGGGAGRVGGGLLGVAGRVGLAPEARTFTAARNAYISRLSRALGEVGVLTDQDIARAREAVPNINDSPREVQLKLASLRRIINDAYNELQAQFQ